MARKIGTKATGKPAAKSQRAKPVAPSQQAAPQEIEILHPERVITLGDRSVEVREYGFIEGLRLQAMCQAFIDDLFALVDGGDGPPSAEAIRGLFVVHVLTVHWLMAQAVTPLIEDPQAFLDAVRKHLDWIATLDDLQGDALLAAWWGVNGGFFTRRLRERKQALLASSAPTSRSASAASTPP